MTISTLDGIVAGRRPLESIYKIGATTEAAGLPHSHWYSTGRPSAGAAPSPGVNGASVVSPVTGQIPHTDPAGGLNAYLQRFSMGATQGGIIMLCDRLWHNSGLSATSTSAQAITPAALPARSDDGTANGAGVLGAIEWSAAGGAGTPTATLTYTDQDGNTGATAVLTSVATPNAGTFEMWPLASGDLGIRAPTSFIWSATHTSGTFHIILFRILAVLGLGAPNFGDAVDALTGGMPELFDGAVPFIVQVPAVTTAANLWGTYQETHG